MISAVAAAAATVALAAKSPTAEFAAMKRAVVANHSARSISVNSSGGFTVRTVADLGHLKGIEAETVTHLGKTGTGAIRIVNKDAFIKGSFLVLKFWGFKPTQAKKVVGKWIFIPHSSPAYAPFAEGATFESFTADLFAPTGLSFVKAGKLIGVRGSVERNYEKVLQTVFAPTSGTPLPVKETLTYPGHPGKDSTTFGHWNERVRVPVPQRAIPIEVINNG